MKKIFLFAIMSVLFVATAVSTANLASSKKATVVQSGPVPLPTCPSACPNPNGQ